jgi:hypothetical protein
MHTCSALRFEASRLFWSHPDIWYTVEADSLESTQTDLEFAVRVMQVEIRLGYAPLDLPYECSDVEIRRAVDIFWRSHVQGFFPSASKIVLAEGWLFRTPPPNWKSDRRWRILGLLLQRAPEHVRVYAALETKDAPRSTVTLMNIDSTERAEWQVVEERWKGKRVLLPSRRLPTGPLQDYEAMLKIQSDIRMEDSDLRWLMIETHSSFPNPGTGSGWIRCPNGHCRMLLHSNGAWREHLRSWTCRRIAETVSSQNTPAFVEDALDARRTQMLSLRKQYVEAWLALRGNMGDEQSERRASFTATLEEQLEKLFPSTIPRSTERKERYMHQGFWVYFDPTHVYYSPAVRDYDTGAEEERSVDLRSESSDSSGWGSPYEDPERQQRLKEQRDDFWKNAGFASVEQKVIAAVGKH